MRTQPQYYLAALLAVAAFQAHAAPAIVDAPAPLMNTEVALLDQTTGDFAWLDDHTLAITTYAETGETASRGAKKVVAYDTRSKNTTTLVPRGSLMCTNPAAGVVGIETGAQRKRYFPRPLSPGPAPHLFQWDAARSALVPADLALKQWNPGLCLKTSAADLIEPALSLAEKPLRYLQPQHGVIRQAPGGIAGRQAWSLDADGKRTALPIDLKLLPGAIPYLPFEDAYLIARGQTGAATPSGEYPMILMKPNGSISRRSVSPVLKQVLYDHPGFYETILLYRAKPGDVAVVNSGTSEGGAGIYLSSNDKIKRIWCVATAGEAVNTDQACKIEQAVTLSPDGCKLAFGSKLEAYKYRHADAGSVMILDLCAPAALAQAGAPKDGTKRSTL